MSAEVAETTLNLKETEGFKCPPCLHTDEKLSRGKELRCVLYVGRSCEKGLLCLIRLTELHDNCVVLLTVRHGHGTLKKKTKKNNPCIDQGP